MTATDLAKKTLADRLLIGECFHKSFDLFGKCESEISIPKSVRIMRVLCAMGVFKETDIETYTSGRMASAFRARPSLQDNVSTLFVPPLFGLSLSLRISISDNTHPKPVSISA